MKRTLYNWVHLLSLLQANFLQWHPTFHGAFVSARDCFRKQQEELEGKEAPQIVGDVQMPVFNPDEEGNKDLFPHGYVSVTW